MKGKLRLHEGGDTLMHWENVMKKLIPVLILWLGLASSVLAQGDPRRAEIVTKLETMTISIDFKDADFRDVIDFIREYTDINIVIDPEVWEEKSEDELRVSMTLKELNLKSVLKLLLNGKGLTARYTEGVLLIVPEGSEEKELVIRVYDVRDLLFTIKDFPGPQVELKAPGDSGGGGGVGGATFSLEEEGEKVLTEEFIEEMILNNTGGDSWDEGNASLVITENGQMIVQQSTRVHRQISDLLSRLRRFK